MSFILDFLYWLSRTLEQFNQDIGVALCLAALATLVWLWLLIPRGNK